jgi:hypothetical protein
VELALGDLELENERFEGHFDSEEPERSEPERFEPDSEEPEHSGSMVLAWQGSQHFYFTELDREGPRHFDLPELDREGQRHFYLPEPDREGPRRFDSAGALHFDYVVLE